MDANLVAKLLSALKVQRKMIKEFDVQDADDWWYAGLDEADAAITEAEGALKESISGTE